MKTDKDAILRWEGEFLFLGKIYLGRTYFWDFVRGNHAKYSAGNGKDYELPMKEGYCSKGDARKCLEDFVYTQLAPFRNLILEEVAASYDNPESVRIRSLKQIHGTHT